MMTSPRPVSLLFALAFAVSACKGTPGATQATGCGTRTAMVGVRDGYLSIICGCDEAAGTVKLAGSALTCTVPVNTWVVFDYSTTTLFHQIIPLGTPAISTSPLRNPSAAIPVPSHVVQLTTLATYRFADRFSSALSGQIVTR
jgi:hypothetical protein